MKRFVRLLLLLFLIGCSKSPEVGHAKNVILFLGDGTGIPTINAASIYGYGEPQRLYIQNMPYIGLSDTSSADSWVSDSAAGMTAIVTGQKTKNGVISQSAEAVRGESDGTVLKTLLELAEERGLSTGVVSNSSMADATPAACYAHCNDRGKTGEIFSQILHPRFGDGVDVVIGPGRASILTATAELDLDLSAELSRAGYTFVDSQSAAVEASRSKTRLVALYSSSDFDLALSVQNALDILSRNPKGFFLMVESNNHSKDVRSVLDNLVKMDRIIRESVQRMTNTLILFAADHSYDIHIPKAPRIQDIVDYVAVDGSHTAEEVLVAATGPGAEKIKGYFPNTYLFEVIKGAYGW
jgi:alkaline phosphatase